MTARAAGLPGVRRLRLSTTLSTYVARQYVMWFLVFLTGLAAVVVLASIVDLLDRLTPKHATLGVAISMAMLKLPYLLQEIMPFTVLFAGLACFWRLTRSNELVVTRAAGISVWQILIPVVSAALVIGVLSFTALNPLAALLLGRYDQLGAKYIHNQESTLSVSRNGLWLRQADSNGQAVIHARRATHDTMTLHDVIVFRFKDQDRFVGRIDAKKAQLEPGKWIFLDAWESRPGRQSIFAKRTELPTNLTRNKILESFAAPQTISFWNLPDFIELLETAGFTAVAHKLQFHRLLATPFLFAAMVLLAASFSLRPQRRGRVGLVILAGVVTGFLLYFVSSFVFALGLSGKIPYVLAAWTPAGVSLMLAVATLLHLEDG